MAGKENKNNRKREERSIRKAHQNNRKQKEISSSYLLDDENFAGFSNQLATIGLKLRDISADGNCLFRALGDQIDGHSSRHLYHREQTVRYMVEHRNDFEPFVEDDCTFDNHVRKLRQDGTYAGNDAIVAFARNNNVNVVIHQLNTPMWTITGSDRQNAPQIHIAYHNGDHYSSVRKLTDISDNPTNIKLTTKTENKGKSSKRESRKKQASPGAVSHKMVAHISNVTGCQDLSLIQQLLEDWNSDVDLTIGMVLQFMQADTSDEDSQHSRHSANSNSSKPAQLWDSNGTGARLFGSNNIPSHSRDTSKKKSNIGQPQKRVSNKNRKELARKERKKRSDERKKNTTQQSSPSDSDESGILVKNMDILKV
uniref:OTU domain-containing protein 3 n=1 Tax=Phallusia mammillata TaxID=59560 RepID=A0A6F9DNJ0_9ASCI|nr:OTU domain-containing protein 3-like [Phallusia mammillata]